jgi:type I restriction enzyme, S subunit
MDNWRTLSLRDAGVVLIDCVHNTPPAVEAGYPYIAIPQMKNGRVDFSDARRISREDFIEWTKKARPQVHDVVLSRRTNPGVTATFGAACEFALGQNLVLLRADGRFVRPEFLRWLTVSPAWWSQIEKFNNVGAVFDSLRCADVPRFELPIPPLRDQHAIATILGALDDEIDLSRPTLRGAEQRQDAMIAGTGTRER